MTAARGISFLILAMVSDLVLAPETRAQSDAPPSPAPTAERLRDMMMKLPETIKLPENAPDKAPTEAERFKDSSRRDDRGPGYVAPLSTPTSSGRMGAAGWTTSGQSGGPSATSSPERPGWAGFGFSVEWGGRSEAP